MLDFLSAHVYLPQAYALCLWRIHMYTVIAMCTQTPKASTPCADKHNLGRIGILAIPVEAGRTRSFLPSILCGICTACAGAVAAAVTDRAPESTAGLVLLACSIAIGCAIW